MVCSKKHSIGAGRTRHESDSIRRESDCVSRDCGRTRRMRVKLSNVSPLLFLLVVVFKNNVLDWYPLRNHHRDYQAYGDCGFERITWLKDWRQRQGHGSTSW